VIARDAKREFTVANAYRYNQNGAGRWIISHLLRYKHFVATFLLGAIVSSVLASAVPTLTGAAFSLVLRGGAVRGQLAWIALAILGATVGRSLCDIGASFSTEFLGKRVERDAREELYVSLLGKSQTFHNRQRVGDLMARAANDVGQINAMIVPGLTLLVDAWLSLVVPIIFIGLINWKLLLMPLLFCVVFIPALRRYLARFQPVADGLRAQFGVMNAGLNESLSGIEVVKSTAQEPFELGKFAASARRYRDLFWRNGQIQARYLPLLLLTVATVGAFVQGLYLVGQHELSIGGLVSFMGLMWLLRWPAFSSIFTFALMQFGIAAGRRIIILLKEETELDENAAGYSGTIRGEIVFDHITFSHGGTPVLKDISFRVEPGQTLAIVGQTGTGKSTLTKLVNRIYDVDSGCVLVDGVDVRDWSLAALRSQISTIEQDITLFSRSIRENIAFSRGQQADFAAIIQAARDAQAHDFITGFREGYDTVVGERGVTLSGGQRQRVAIARALLTDPRILVLDDSTSAIDSATEDGIQQAMRRLMEGRTTLLITHRLSQIRWADKVVVLSGGGIVDQGTHDELLARCDLYRRIFAHYDTLAPAGQTTVRESVAER
jgi:ATP-binding cassette subfamily B protein